MKLREGGKRRDLQFDLGAFVYFKLKPYKQDSLARRPFEKLAAGFHEPYKTVQRIRSLTYQIIQKPPSFLHL